MVQTIPALAIGKRIDFTHAISGITRTLSILAEPGQVVELRIPGFNGRRTDSGYFTDFEKLARAAASYNGRAEGIYITLNPLNPALLARSSNRVTEYAKNTSGDRDVTNRRWLFVDFDPVRPAGISSSDAEHETSIDRATNCREWLQAKAIPSVLADSGNGAHVLIPIFLPNTDESTTLLKSFLCALSGKYSDAQVEIDTSTVNASRIIKLYGTLACKGDNVPERPHRQAMILAVPETLEPVDLSVLQSLAAERVSPESPPEKVHTLAESRSVSARKKVKQNGASDRMAIDEIKAQLDMVAYAESKLGVGAVKQGSEYRFPGHHGFLVNSEKGCWYHHGGQHGGDALDLIGYLLHGSTWNRQNAALFKEVLHEAAVFAKISLPDVPSRTNSPSASTSNPSTAGPLPGTASAAAEKPTAEIKFDLLDVARCWQHRLGNELAWDTKAAVWRRWTGTHWLSDTERENFDLLASDMLRTMGMLVNQSGKIDGVIRLARALCKRSFSPARRLLNFQNGTLDLETMVGHAHQSSDNLTECLPYDYIQDGSFPTLQRFIEVTIPDTDGQRAYMTHLGLALIGNRSFHKALVLLGPPRSGKTTLLKLAQCTLGCTPGQFPTAVLFSPESRGANSRAAWIDQSPRLVCLDEFPEEAVRDEGEELFKSMAAHGGVSMWLKYRDERAENIWTPKLIFATNNRMRYRDPSGALTRRLLIIECPNSLPDPELDGNLLEKFTPELGAFAAACIQLALQAEQSHIYPESTAMRVLLADIERNGDTVKLWLQENCVFEPDSFVPTQALYRNFRGWCEDNGLHAVSRPKLRDSACGTGTGVRCTRQRAVDPADGTKKLLWGITGLRLRTVADDPEGPN